jgi:hypothetical protein
MAAPPPIHPPSFLITARRGADENEKNRQWHPFLLHRRGRVGALPIAPCPRPPHAVVIPPVSRRRRENDDASCRVCLLANDVPTTRPPCRAICRSHSSLARRRCGCRPSSSRPRPAALPPRRVRNVSLGGGRSRRHPRLLLLCCLHRRIVGMRYALRWALQNPPPPTRVVRDGGQDDGGHGVESRKPAADGVVPPSSSRPRPSVDWRVGYRDFRVRRAVSSHPLPPPRGRNPSRRLVG